MFGFKKAKKSVIETLIIDNPQEMHKTIGQAKFDLIENLDGTARAIISELLEDGSVRRLRECEFPTYLEGKDFYYDCEKILTA